MTDSIPNHKLADALEKEANPVPAWMDELMAEEAEFDKTINSNKVNDYD
ncbi:MAG: hypothetical protein GY941_20990 [Planctomycetes bacterium]|nr:hypothetical protein [Planctomycetota bacterium]